MTDTLHQLGYFIESDIAKRHGRITAIQKRINRRIAIRNLATVLAVLGSFALLYIYLETYDEIAVSLSYICFDHQTTRRI